MTQQSPDHSLAHRILVIEDDEFLRHSLKQALEGAGFETFAFEHAKRALEQLPELRPDAVLTDLYLSEKDSFNGMRVIEELQALDNELPVVLMTARGNIPIAIEAIRKGAYDFLEKPFEKDRLIGLLKRATTQRRLTFENRNLRERLAVASGIERILVGKSAAMRSLSGLVLHLAPIPANVLILGETGSGKEMVARCLHEFSGRQGPFVAINCAAVPETLFESELFGHEAGAYTGAGKQRVGKLEYSSGGTLFLDEIEAMPLHLQAKILRVLQERQVERLGSNKTISLDLRVVAATKVDLKEHSERDKFRLDLYYRLNVATLKIPALRERREDIPLLLDHFIREAALRFGQPAVTPGKEVQQQLIMHDWPGNVRELRNVAEQLQLRIPLAIGEPVSQTTTQSLEGIVAVVEKAVIADTLRRHEGAATSTCTELQINYSTLYRKMKQYGMDLSDYKNPAGAG
ncbi:MAG: sigma-54-dependent transcriptional regulator [Noviherbaspirillum sp.]